MSRRVGKVLAAFMLLLLPIAAQAQESLIVDRLELGHSVILQGCVAPAEYPGTYVLTRIASWPIVRADASGKRTASQFFTRRPIEDIEDYVGQTIQLEGVIESLGVSEIETEPGLHNSGRLVEYEQPGPDILVDANLVGLHLPRGKKEDIATTLIGVDVHHVMTVMPVCLPTQ